MMRNGKNLKVIYFTIVSAGILVVFITNAAPKEIKTEQEKQSVSSVWQAPASADELKNPLAGNLKAAAEGKQLFQTYCVTCHGSNGSGNGVTAATLNPKPADLTLKRIQKQSDGAIFWKITTGRPPMVSWKYTLTDKQRWELVDYIRQLEKK